MVPLVHAVVCLAVLVVVPLGLRLVGGDDVAVVRRLWWAPAGLVAVAVWLPAGPWAAAAIVPYLLLVVALALVAARRGLRVLRDRLTVDDDPVVRTAVEVAVVTALAMPAIAGTALVAERAGVAFLGFDLEVLALTVAHFHFAGFTAALVAALVARAVQRSPLAPADRAAAHPPAVRLPAVLAALCVPGGTLVVLAGFFVGDALELVGAAVLTAGMWAAAWLTWRRVRPDGPDGVTRALFGVSAIVLVATMALALVWAVGEATGLPHPPIGWMAATHGLANALGFGLCAVLAWTRTNPRPL